MTLIQHGSDVDDVLSCETGGFTGEPNLVELRDALKKTSSAPEDNTNDDEIIIAKSMGFMSLEELRSKI